MLLYKKISCYAKAKIYSFYSQLKWYLVIQKTFFGQKCEQYGKYGLLATLTNGKGNYLNCNLARNLLKNAFLKRSHVLFFCLAEKFWGKSDKEGMLENARR